MSMNTVGSLSDDEVGVFVGPGLDDARVRRVAGDDGEVS